MIKLSESVSLETRDGVALVVVDNPPVNALSQHVRAGLDAAFPAIAELLCEHDRRGQKTGRGYYLYNPDTRAAAPDPEVEELVRELAERQGIERREIDDDEIRNRCLYSMVNEGAKILDEGIAQRSSDIDVVWVNGYGWPIYRGGPMYWADEEGLAEIVDTCDRYRERFSEAGAATADAADAWEVAPLLRRLASEGGHFT